MEKRHYFDYILNRTSDESKMQDNDDGIMYTNHIRYAYYVSNTPMNVKCGSLVGHNVTDATNCDRLSLWITSFASPKTCLVHDYSTGTQIIPRLVAYEMKDV